MIYPDKFTSLDRSVMGKSTHLLRDPGTQITISRLRTEALRAFPDVTEFILALDVLFSLEKIELDDSGEVITYVG